MHANNPGVRLRHLCSQHSRRQSLALAFGCVAGVLASIGIIDLLLWTADTFPILPGPPMLDPWTRLIVSAILGPVLAVVLVVSIRNRYGRLLRQAEQLAEGGEQIRAARVLHQATGRSLEECVRLIETYLAGRPAAAAPRTLPEEVRRLAEAGEQLRAVERLRELSGVGLPEAMRRVEQHLGARPWWQELADDPGQKVEAIHAYREEHGVDLDEAAHAVADYLRERGSRA